MVNYSFSKQLDNIAGVRDPDKDFLEKAPSGIDHPHVGSATFVYQLPLGAGHGWNSSNRVLSSAISNWQFFGIFTFTSGSPLFINGICVGGGIINAVCFPNYNPSFTGSVWQNGGIGSSGANVGTTPYLNEAAFIDPANYSAGNIARTAPLGLRVPHNADFDLSVRREFRLIDCVRLSSRLTLSPVGIFAGGVVFGSLLPKLKIDVAGVSIDSFWIGLRAGDCAHRGCTQRWAVCGWWPITMPNRWWC